MNQVQQTIATQFELGSMPEKEREVAMDKIGEVIFNSIFIQCMEELPENDKDELDEVLEKNSGDMDSIFDFFGKKLPGFQKIVDSKISEFKQRALSVPLDI
jgi:hypothetical protein